MAVGTYKDSSTTDSEGDTNWNCVVLVRQMIAIIDQDTSRINLTPESFSPHLKKYFNNNYKSYKFSFEIHDTFEEVSLFCPLLCLCS